MVRHTAAGPHGHFHGVVRCGSWSACPSCSWTLRLDRSTEVRRCVEWWRVQGWAVELLTLTLAHGMGDDLRELRNALQRCWRILLAGQPGKRLKRVLGLQHYVRGTDDTYGANGWHPHFHVVVFTRGRERGALTQLRQRWHDAVLKVLGRHYVPSWSRGADLRECQRDEYIAKLGLELTSAQTKAGRRQSETPWDLARRAAAGDIDAIRLWQEYTRATKGVRQLVWSRDLRKAAGLGVEQTDQQIVDAEGRDAEETCAASIPCRLWDEVVRSPMATHAIIEGAERDGQIGVARALALHLYGLAPPDPGEQTDQLVLDLFNDIAPRETEPARAAA